MKGVFKKLTAAALAAMMTFSVVPYISYSPLAPQAVEAATVTITESSGWLESAYVEWNPVDNATSYKVYVAQSGGEYTQLDDALIRRYSGYWRADAVGLEPGTYTMKVEAFNGSTSLGSAETASFSVEAYDRNGAAFSPSSTFEGAGAYNIDGTLKSGAKVIYVTPENAATVTATIGGVSCTGIQSILTALQKGKETSPVDIRVVGMITEDDVDSFGSSAEGLQVKGKSNYSDLNLTIEGIGEDSGFHGFGLLIRNAGNVELRNFAVMNCLDDSISLDTGNCNVWVHNLDLFYGQTGGDSDQAKGDGTVDMKGKSTYITVSYNHFWDNGKSSLCGMKSETTDCFITYHHNWFDHSDSRHPRIRTMSVHVYNNYFDGNSKYGVGVTMGSSCFVEANYFRNVKHPMMSSGQGTDAQGDGTFSGETGGIIKSYNNEYVDGGSVLDQNSTSSTGADVYEVSSRTETVPSSVTTVSGGTTYNNFDTGTSIDINVPASAVDDPANVPAKVKKYAGRVNGGDFSYTFDNATEDTNYSVITNLKSAVVGYTTSIVSYGGSADGSTVTTTTTEATTETTTASTGKENTTETTTKVTEQSSEATTESEIIIDSSAKVHNFTTNGKSSTFYTINGNLSDTKGTITYNGLTLTQCLKMESSTYVDFTPEADGTFIVVKSGTGSILLNESALSFVTEDEDARVATVSVNADESYELSKGSGTSYLYYIAYIPNGASIDESSSSTSSTTTTTTEATTETTTEAVIEDNVIRTDTTLNKSNYGADDSKFFGSDSENVYAHSSADAIRLTAAGSITFTLAKGATVKINSCSANKSDSTRTITLSGPNSFSKTVTQDVSYVEMVYGTDLAAGTYTVKSSNHVNINSITVTFSSSSTKEVIKGDADGSGTVDNADVTHILNYLTGKITALNDAVAAEVTGDNKITSSDAYKIKRYLLGIITSLE